MRRSRRPHSHPSLDLIGTPGIRLKLNNIFVSIRNKILGFKTKLSTHPTFQNSSEATVRLHFKRLQRWSKLRLSIAGPFAGLLEPLQTCFVQSLLLITSLLLFIETPWALVSAIIYTGRLVQSRILNSSVSF